MLNNIDFIVGLESNNEVSWPQHFYPEDLPNDWYLDYYSNEYQVLLLGEKVQPNCAFFIDILEQVEEAFFEQFTLCLPESFQNVEEVNAKLQSSSELNVVYYEKFHKHNELKEISFTLIDSSNVIKVRLTPDFSTKDLKALYDNCVKIISHSIADGKLQPENEIYVIFSDSKEVLKHANEFQLLVEMMQ